MSAADEQPAPGQAEPDRPSGDEASPDGERRPPGPPLPRWVALIFLAGCLALIPQILGLSSTLREVQMVNHWRTTWVGLDIAESLVFLLTGWFLYRRSRLVAVTASIAFAMLWLDAWFDVMTSIAADDIATSRTLALFLELPLGLFCLWIALRSLGVRIWPSRSRRRP
jgi:hypothetical protein